MEIVFTRHAKQRAKERQIELKEIINTITNFQIKALEDSKINKIAYYKKINSKLAIKVVARKIEENILVITVHHVDLNVLTKIKPFIEKI